MSTNKTMSQEERNALFAGLDEVVDAEYIKTELYLEKLSSQVKGTILSLTPLLDIIEELKVRIAKLEADNRELERCNERLHSEYAQLAYADDFPDD